ncbi:MAG: FUSC family protein [Thiohalocapsa sp.]|uniref:FUSC family protein n=1 Tax=Thiohalocapsa sp. TaxID=2497641 RepID=UPI0025ED923C|nr:FUSC family protein [Thiohalocapsa sp.]MCG6940213.1 FUSC family protein [Thiohalocapsa sp.]
MADAAAPLPRPQLAGRVLGSTPLWSPTAAVNALKTAIGIIAAWYIALWLNWPEPFMAPLAVVTLQTPYLGASLQKGLMRSLGTLTGALLVLLLLAWLVQSQWPLITALSLVIGAGIYAMRHSRYAYAWFMLTLNVALIATDAAAAPDSAFELAVYRSAQTIVGILVVLVVNGLFWPRTGGRAYAHKLAEIRRELTAHLDRLGAQVAAATPVESPRALRGAGVALREILAAAALDSGGFRQLHRTYEAQVQAIGDLVGSLMAFGEGLRLVAEGDAAVLSAEERGMVADVLHDLARAVDALGGTGSAAAAATRAALAAAHAGCERLLGSARDPVPGLIRAGRDSALLHAAALQLRVLMDEVQTLADTSAAVAAGRRLPPADLPADRQPVTLRRLANGLPDALAVTLAYWTMMLVWIELQWPPVGFIGVLMAVAVVGLDALTALPVRQSAWAAIFGAFIGLVITAPVYLLVMPRLDGFTELTLVLFPFFYAIAYLFHALPRPRNMVVLRVAIIALIMVNLSPSQHYDAAAYLNVGLSVLTGFVVGVALLGILRGMTPRERLRRRLKALLQTLDTALADLADPRRPGFERVVRQHVQALRAEQQLIAEIAPQVYAPHVPQNDPRRIRALVEAAEALSIRFRALQRARARWLAAGASQAPTAGAGNERAHALAERWRGAFRCSVRALLAGLERPYAPVTLTALDTTRARALADLEALHHQHAPHSAPDPAPDMAPDAASDATLLRLGIAGHYVGVARALRESAAAFNAIDWAAWQIPRF